MWSNKNTTTPPHTNISILMRVRFEFKLCVTAAKYWKGHGSMTQMMQAYNYRRSETQTLILGSASESHYSTLIFAPLRREQAVVWLAIQKVLFGFLITQLFWICNGLLGVYRFKENKLVLFISLFWIAFWAPSDSRKCQIFPSYTETAAFIKKKWKCR